MRKRSSYRPKGVILDTMKWVTSGLKPLVSEEEQNMKLRLRNHSAFTAIELGAGTRDDIDLLISVSNMTTALSRKHGSDWKEEIRAGADAVEAIRNRYNKWGKVQITDDERDSITLLFQIHDAQLDKAVINDLDNAVRIAKANRVLCV